MGTERFVAMVENAKLKKARREEISDLECVCMSARAALLEVIKLRQDATEWEIEIGSSRHTRAAPLSFDEAATPLAKSKAVYRWEPSEGKFLKESVQSFLDGTGHLVSSFVILGAGGAGKSRLLHAMATELAVGAGKPRYLFGKSLRMPSAS
jgi:DNA replication protein DnaC